MVNLVDFVRIVTIGNHEIAIRVRSENINPKMDLRFQTIGTREAALNVRASDAVTERKRKGANDQADDDRSGAAFNHEQTFRFSPFVDQICWNPELRTPARDCIIEYNYMSD